jgi:hypothetical protein
VQGLHAKLDRKRTVETANETAKGNFHTQFKTCIDSMAEEITGSTAKQTQNIKSMQDMLGRTSALPLDFGFMFLSCSFCCYEAKGKSH